MPGTILIVEDHHALRNSLQMWLGMEFPLYLVIGAATGEEAVAICRYTAPDAIVMDINLPQMSGIEATELILSSVQHTEVLMLTIHEEDIYRTRALAAGAGAFILKRDMYTELVPALSALLAHNGLEQAGGNVTQTT